MDNSTAAARKLSTQKIIAQHHPRSVYSFSDGPLPPQALVAGKGGHSPIRSYKLKEDLTKAFRKNYNPDYEKMEVLIKQFNALIDALTFYHNKFELEKGNPKRWQALGRIFQRAKNLLTSCEKIVQKDPKTDLFKFVDGCEANYSENTRTFICAVQVNIFRIRERGHELVCYFKEDIEIKRQIAPSLLKWLESEGHHPHNLSIKSDETSQHVSPTGGNSSPSDKLTTFKRIQEMAANPVAVPEQADMFELLEAEDQKQEQQQRREVKALMNKCLKAKKAYIKACQNNRRSGAKGNHGLQQAVDRTLASAQQLCRQLQSMKKSLPKQIAQSITTFLIDDENGIGSKYSFFLG